VPFATAQAREARAMAATPPEPPPERGTTPTPNPPPGTPTYGSEPTGYGYGFETTTTNGLAIASLVFGIAGLVFFACGVGSILALVFGYMARGQIDRSQGRESGRGVAIAGIIMRWIGVAILVIFWVVVAIIAATTDNNGNSMALIGHALSV
jgi:hypothetical protein